MKGNLNRRSFVKGAALGAAGLVAGGALSACSPAAKPDDAVQDAAATATNSPTSDGASRSRPIPSATTSSPKRSSPTSWWWEAA